MTTVVNGFEDGEFTRARVIVPRKMSASADRLSAHCSKKKELRVRLRQQRRSLPATERWALDARAQERIIAHRWFKKARNVALYRAFDGETATDLIEFAARDAGKNVLFARVRQNAPLDFVEPAAWRFGRGGLPIPWGPSVVLGDADLIVVPGVAFAPNGHRLGMGGGHYDRTLCESNAKSIGLAYELQRLPALPTAAWDIPLDALATDVALYESCSRESVSCSSTF